MEKVWNWAKDKWDGLNKQLKWFIAAVAILIVISLII
jgi:type IV secretory pathway component VirB8